ncbi:MAG: hypothetical protein WCH09_08410 [Bacteroidota bacterium]
MAVVITTATVAYATCTGKTKSAPVSGNTCGSSSEWNGTSCTYSAPSPSYDVCDTDNTADTGKVCSTGPELHSGIKTVSYTGTCLDGDCNNGTSQGEGTLMSPQPKKAKLDSCGGA